MIKIYLPVKIFSLSPRTKIKRKRKLFTLSWKYFAANVLFMNVNSLGIKRIPIHRYFEFKNGVYSIYVGLAAEHTLGVCLNHFAWDHLFIWERCDVQSAAKLFAVLRKWMSNNSYLMPFCGINISQIKISRLHIFLTTMLMIIIGDQTTKKNRKCYHKMIEYFWCLLHVCFLWLFLWWRDL